MAILAKTFTAAQRRKLGNVLFIIHLICAACGLAFVGLGIYIKIRLSAWLTLIDGYNDNLLPLMMVIVGALLVVVDISGGKLVLSVEGNSRLRYLLIPYLCIVFILSLCILTAGSICFVHQKHLSKAFHRGLTNAMQRYKDNSTYKTKIDNVQIKFECCGNLGYEDWFDVQWINNKFIDLDDPEVKRCSLFDIIMLIYVTAPSRHHHANCKSQEAVPVFRFRTHPDSSDQLRMSHKTQYIVVATAIYSSLQYRCMLLLQVGVGYLRGKMANGQFLNDDVPFSCCDPGIARHCIHHHIHDNNMHYNYDYRTDLTIFPKGCRSKLMGYYRFRLGNVGAIVMAMFVMQVGILIGLRYLQTAVHNSAKDPDGDSQGWLIKRLSKKETKKDWREDRDVESGDAEDAGEDVGEDAGSGSGSGSGSYVDSFDSDSFESDEDAGGGGVQHVQAQQQQEEPVYANLPFHEDKERLQEALQETAASTTSSSKKQKSGEKDVADSKKSKKDSNKKDTKKDSSKKDSKKSGKKDSKKDSSKKDSKKDSSKKGSKKSSKKDSPKKDSKASKSPKKDSKTKSPSKKTSPSKKKASPTKKKSPSKKKASPSKKKASTGKSKSLKKSPVKKKTKSISPKSKKMKSKKTKTSMKSGGSKKKSKKMKNMNNNIEDVSSSSDGSYDESDFSDTAPLLGRFYSSSEEEELFRETTHARMAMSSALQKSDNANNNEGSPEVTWLLSRTQFYSTPPTISKYTSNYKNEL